MRYTTRKHTHSGLVNMFDSSDAVRHHPSSACMSISMGSMVKMAAELLRELIAGCGRNCLHCGVCTMNLKFRERTGIWKGCICEEIFLESYYLPSAWTFLLFLH